MTAPEGDVRGCLAAAPAHTPRTGVNRSRGDTPFYKGENHAASHRHTENHDYRVRSHRDRTSLRV